MYINYHLNCQCHQFIHNLTGQGLHGETIFNLSLVLGILVSIPYDIKQLWHVEYKYFMLICSCTCIVASYLWAYPAHIIGALIYTEASLVYIYPLDYMYTKSYQNCHHFIEYLQSS